MDIAPASPGAFVKITHKNSKKKLIIKFFYLYLPPLLGEHNA